MEGSFNDSICISETHQHPWLYFGESGLINSKKSFPIRSLRGMGNVYWKFSIQMLEGEMPFKNNRL